MDDGKRTAMPDEGEAGMERWLLRVVRRRVEPAGGGAETFRQANVCPYNRGVVVRLPDGREFELTVNETTR